LGVDPEVPLGYDGDFLVTDNLPCNTSLGASCPITIEFRPSALGLRTATLDFLVNIFCIEGGDSGRHQGEKCINSINLTGAGIPPVAAAPASLDFGNQAVGKSSKIKTTTFTNNLDAFLYLVIPSP
jgi:hypothetical protein